MPSPFLRVLSFLLLAGLGAQRPLAAQSPPLPLAPGAHLTIVSPNGRYTEPGIALNPANPKQIVVVYQGGPEAAQGKGGISYSIDGGRSFLRANRTVPADWRVVGDVTTAFDNHGRAFLCYLAFDKLGTPSYWAHNAGRNGIFVLRSPDGGKTWDKAAVAVKSFAKGNEPDLQFEDEPRIFSDTNPASPHAGNLYVGWVEWQLTQSIMLFSSSTDGGKTWSPPIRVSTRPGLPRDDNGSLGGFGLAVAPDGVLSAIWHDGNNITLTQSKDGGKTFTPSRPIFETAPPYFGDVPGVSRVEGFPQMSAGKSGKLYICWSDYRNGDVDVFIATSADNGRTWSKPVRVNSDSLHNGSDQFYQWMTLDAASGDLYVIFYDRRHDPADRKTRVTLARSTDGGRSFENYAWTQEGFNAGGAFLGDYTWLTAYQGNVYGAWTETTAREGEKIPRSATQDRGPATPLTFIRVGVADFSLGK
jgi:hypothetical protein